MTIINNMQKIKNTEKIRQSQYNLKADTYKEVRLTFCHYLSIFVNKHTRPLVKVISTHPIYDYMSTSGFQTVIYIAFLFDLHQINHRIWCETREKLITWKIRCCCGLPIVSCLNVY